MELGEVKYIHSLYSAMQQREIDRQKEKPILSDLHLRQTRGLSRMYYLSTVLWSTLPIGVLDCAFNLKYNLVS